MSPFLHDNLRCYQLSAAFKKAGFSGRYIVHYSETERPKYDRTHEQARAFPTGEAILRFLGEDETKGAVGGMQKIARNLVHIYTPDEDAYDAFERQNNFRTREDLDANLSRTISPSFAKAYRVLADHMNKTANGKEALEKALAVYERGPGERVMDGLYSLKYAVFG